MPSVHLEEEEQLVVVLQEEQHQDEAHLRVEDAGRDASAAGTAAQRSTPDGTALNSWTFAKKNGGKRPEKYAGKYEGARPRAFVCLP